MFEAAELGRKVSKQEYAAQVDALRADLLEAQRALLETDLSVVVIVSGVEGAGKSEVVNRLTEWLDTRGVITHSFWDETDEERQRPRFWRFWRALPPRKRVGILFGSWYTQPIIDRVFDEIDEPRFAAELERIARFERMLSEDGALIVKFWFHLSKKDQKQRIKESRDEKRRKALSKSGWKLSPLAKRFSKRYDVFAAVSERAIRATDAGVCPWYLIESSDRRYRDLTVGRTLLAALRERLAHPRLTVSQPIHRPATLPDGERAQVTILDHVDLSHRLDDDAYDARLEAAQRRLFDLTWAAHQAQRSLVAVFEGWDASGKGGAIRRVTGAMDARLFRVVPVAAPSDEERAQHYLWRFWRHMPRAGYMRIFDRSWYGRVLVERVEGFAAPAEWMRAYQEINDMEAELTEAGTGLVKVWLHISREEQLRRFEERQATAHKQHKIGPEDWRNREKWDLYEAAVNDMVARTSTSYAPWTLVAGNDKRVARVQVVETFCERLEALLGG